MSDVHAGPFEPYEPGLCGWRHHACGVWLSCSEAAAGVSELCEQHRDEVAALIAATDRADQETQP